MIYQLKTTNVCNNNCVYCKHLNKKSRINKSFLEIKKEFFSIKKRGYTELKLSCNCDQRRDFLKILKLAKENNLKVTLETNGRIFCYKRIIKEADHLINKYEVYFSFNNKDVCSGINLSGEDIFEQTLRGLSNLGGCVDNKKLTAKIVILNSNLIYIKNIIDIIYSVGITRIKLIYPFRKKGCTSIPPVVEFIQNIDEIKKYISDKKIILINNEIEHNPYVTTDLDFLDQNNYKLKMDRSKNSLKRFSVIIPTRNNKKTLPHVLKSFFEQKYPKNSYEIIVVDDGSDDGTYKDIEKIKFNCNLKYIYWPRPSIGGDEKRDKWYNYYNRAGFARNIGINNARGDIVLFNDADIVVEPDCLKKHEIYHKNGDGVIVRGFRNYLSGEHEIKIKDFKLNTKNITPEKSAHKRISHCRSYEKIERWWQRFVTANLSVKKNFLIEAGLFSAESPYWGYEDVELGYRLNNLGLKLVWDDNINVYHVHHAKQTIDDLNTMVVFWINTNIFLRKYLDKDIYNIYKDVIINKLDDLIL